MSRPLGLGALLHGTGGTEDGMSLPRMMRAYERGEIAAPPGDDLGGLMGEPSPPRPVRPSPYQAELAAQEQAQARQDAIDREEMRVTVRQKLNAAAAEQKWDAARRLAAIETELINGGQHGNR